MISIFEHVKTILVSKRLKFSFFLSLLRPLCTNTLFLLTYMYLFTCTAVYMCTYNLIFYEDECHFLKSFFLFANCKHGNVRVGVILALFSSSRILPHAKLKPIYLYEENRSVIVKITPTWNVLPMFSLNIPPATITTFIVTNPHTLRGNNKKNK